MIPLRDTIPSRRVPFLTWILIAANASVFVWMLGAGPGIEDRLTAWAVIPANLLGHAASHGDPVARFLPLLSSMFLHAGWLHLVGNMLFLYIFGDNVEDVLGHTSFLAFYLLSGVVSALVQALAAPQSTIPIVGASGAIAGLLGAYFVLFPQARIVTMIPLVILFPIVEIPAFFFLLFWFLLQFVSGALALGTAQPSRDGVAWWAHIGGFAVGLLAGLVVRISRAARRGAR